MGFIDKKKSDPFSSDEIRNSLHKNLNFTASEQYRLLRTNVMFTIPEDVKCPIIGVTSSNRGEGKSVTAINLSYVFAEKGSKVLLMDGDLRLPTVAKKMGIKNSPGLTDLLLGAVADINSWRSSVHKNWYILPSGDIPPNPSELLSSKRMENALNTLKQHFDVIIIDLPPVNLVSDAMAASSLITGMLLVVRENYTSRKELEQCVRQIKLSNVNVLGCVMTDSENGGAYRKYGKYGKYGKYSKYGKYYRGYGEEQITDSIHD